MGQLNIKEKTQFSPGILSLIPTLYVGWSDSILSPSEITFVQEKIKELEFLTTEDKEYLCKYTDPKHPPSDDIFRNWRIAIQHHAESLDSETIASLEALGVEIAKQSIGYKNEELWKSPKTKTAIRDIRLSLGIQNRDGAQILPGHLVQEKIHTDINHPLAKEMQHILDGDYKEISDRVKKLLRDPHFSNKELVNKEEYRLHVLEQLKTLADQGLTSFAFPKEYGGKEMSGEHIAVFENLAYLDLSLTIKYGVQLGLFGGAIHGLGTEKHHRKYLKPMMDMDLLGCFAMTETNHGSNVKGLETTATYDQDTRSFLIKTPHEKAGKEYIGNAMHCTMAAVFAQLIVEGKSHGVHAFLVDVRDVDHNLLSGVRIEDCGYKMGLNGVDNGRLWFDNVSVPVDNLLNKYGDIDAAGNYTSPIENPNRRFFTMLGALVTGRVSVGLAANSAAKTALTIAIKYSSQRRQFASKDDQPETIILDYPTHQERLFPLLAKSYAMHFALTKLNTDLAADKDHQNRRKIETKAAGLKAIATWHATNTIQVCREACGGKGYLSENRFTDLKADSDIFTTFEGDNTVLLQLVAKGLLTEFKQSFHEDGTMAVMRYLGSKASQKFSEYNFASTRNSSIDHLRDRQFHMDAFRYREKKLLYTVSTRMQDYIKKRIDSSQAFLKCQIHLIELAKAYVDRLVLRNYIAAIKEMPDGEAKDNFNLMCDLYAVNTLLENKGWFLENDYMEGSKTKALRRLQQKLYQEIRPRANTLVEAFGIPEELLGAKIVLYN